MIKDYKRLSVFCKFPNKYTEIYKLGKLRPHRYGTTNVMYVFGDAGLGKTSSIQRTLLTIHKLYPELDFYTKMGGLSSYRFCDCFDNELICWLDDLVVPNIGKYGDEEFVQRLKNVLLN